MVNAEAIHEASLKLLEEVGVKVEHETVRELLVKHGAKAGNCGDLVRLPRGMVIRMRALLWTGTIGLRFA